MISHVKHPILRLEVLAADGTRADELRVFCRSKRSSVRVEDCSSCVHCDGINDALLSVDCTIELPASAALPDHTGDRTEVGTTLSTGTVVLAASATVGVAAALLRAEDRRAVAIVDAQNVLIGLVHEMSFVGLRPAALRGPVSGPMSTAIALHEATPVRAALRLLAAHHLREATVVSDEGTPIGVFRDVDGLRWIVAARQGC